MNGISIDWFYNPKTVEVNIFDKIVATLFENGEKKITKYSYRVSQKQQVPPERKY